MNSFNVYGQTEKKVGGNTPVWLGTVKPIPVGATFSAEKGVVYKAGSPIYYDSASKDCVISTGDDVNGYLYNDVYSEEGGTATCAVVMHHPEGLLIDRVGLDLSEEQIQQLQEKVPCVLLVRG